jgi:hypothetical protein
MNYTGLVHCGLVVFCVAACGPERPARSPINDAQPPATDPGSGDYMGSKDGATPPGPGTAPDGAGLTIPSTNDPPAAPTH